MPPHICWFHFDESPSKSFGLASLAIFYLISGCVTTELGYSLTVRSTLVYMLRTVNGSISLLAGSPHSSMY